MKGGRNSPDSFNFRNNKEKGIAICYLATGFENTHTPLLAGWLAG